MSAMLASRNAFGAQRLTLLLVQAVHFRENAQCFVGTIRRGENPWSTR